MIRYDSINPVDSLFYPTEDMTANQSNLSNP